MLKGWQWLVSPIRTEQEAVALLYELGKGFYGMAAIQALMLAFLAFSDGDALGRSYDVLLMLLAGYFLPRNRSRLLALMLVLYAIVSTALTFQAQFGSRDGGKNIVLAILLLLLAFRSVQATRAYHVIVGSQIVWRNVAIVVGLHTAALVVSSAIFLFAVGLMAEVTSAPPPSEDTGGTALTLIWLICVVTVFLTARVRWPFTVRIAPSETESLVVDQPTTANTGV